MNEPTVLDPPIFSHSTMSRLLYLNVMLLFALTDWLIKMTHPEENAGNWLAAAAGAFVIRLVLPKISIKLSLSGWLAGFVFALLFASSLAKHSFFTGWDSMAIWGLAGVLGDALLQVVALFIRLGQKLGGYTLEHPGAAFDETLERAEKVTTVWVRIKAPLLDLLNTSMDLLNSLKSKKP